jgi:hypothetical protein
VIELSFTPVFLLLLCSFGLVGYSHLHFLLVPSAHTALYDRLRQEVKITFLVLVFPIFGVPIPSFPQELHTVANKAQEFNCTKLRTHPTDILCEHETYSRQNSLMPHRVPRCLRGDVRRLVMPLLRILT